MMINRPAFKSLQAAIQCISLMTISPYGRGAGDGTPSVKAERTYEIEEFQVREGDREFSIIGLWGSGDYFYLHNKDPENLVLVDGVHDDDSEYQELDATLLSMLQRCMLVGYVPRTLLEAIHDYGRGGPEDEFADIFRDAIDHVEDILESFGV